MSKWLQAGLVAAAILGGVWMVVRSPSMPVAEPEPPRRTMSLSVETRAFELIVRGTADEWYSDCRVRVDGEWTATVRFIPGRDCRTCVPTRLHLADLSKGGIRYDWQTRIPSQIVVTCEQFNPIPHDGWTSMPLRWP